MENHIALLYSHILFFPLHLPSWQSYDHLSHYCRLHSPKAASSVVYPHLPVLCFPTLHRHPSCLCRVASLVCQVRRVDLRTFLGNWLASLQFFSGSFRWLFCLLFSALSLGPPPFTLVIQQMFAKSIVHARHSTLRLWWWKWHVRPL